jgi:hypothetical protein
VISRLAFGGAFCFSLALLIANVRDDSTLLALLVGMPAGHFGRRFYLSLKPHTASATERELP